MNVLTYPVEANEAKAHWEDLLVVAHLTEPIVNWRDDSTLDGPLSWGAYLAYIDEHGDDLPPKNSDWAVDFDLPLARFAGEQVAQADTRMLTADGKPWGWCSSVGLIPDDAAHTTTHVRRKPATERMSIWSDAKRHHVGLGPLKARNVAWPTVATPTVRWWVRGDRTAIEDLLLRVTRVGMMTRAGNGVVSRWEILDGKPDAWRARPMPALDGWPMALRAPLHHPSRRITCAQEDLSWLS